MHKQEVFYMKKQIKTVVSGALAVILALSLNTPSGNAAAEPNARHSARAADKSLFFIVIPPISALAFY